MREGVILVRLSLPTDHQKGRFQWSIEKLVTDSLLSEAFSLISLNSLFRHDI